MSTSSGSKASMRSKMNLSRISTHTSVNIIDVILRKHNAKLASKHKLNKSGSGGKGDSTIIVNQ